MPTFRVSTVKPDLTPGPVLIYSNETSTLVDEATGQSVVQALDVNRSNERNAIEDAKELRGKASPRVLKISLGLSCNYECEYCSQRFVPRADETNPNDVSAFINGLDAWVTTPPERVEFWGGEPLVYIKTLRPLAEAIRAKYPDAQFAIITNGSLLTPEINEWIDAMGFGVGISHDGPGQHVRGPDPLADPDKKAAILDLYRRLAPQQRISFNSMMHRQNMSRAAVVKFFIELTGDPDVQIGEGAIVDAYDEGGMTNSLRADEFSHYRNRAFGEIRTGQAVNFQIVRMKTASFVNSIRTQRPASVVGQKCSMDQSDQIAVDLRGNVLTCQNTSAASVAPNGQSHKIGHVSDLANAKVNTARHWSTRKDCPNCPMLQICQGACMFLEGDLWDRTCDNAYSDAVPIFAAGIEFLTGFIPVLIEGPHAVERHAIWNPPAPKQKIIPIVPVGETNV